MPNDELQTLLAIVFIDAQAVHGVYLFGERFVVPEQDGLDNFPLRIQAQFEMLFADHALVLHGEIVVELRCRKALTPYLYAQQARHVEIHFGMLQCAVSFDALREIVWAEQFAGDLFEGRGKIFKIGLGNTQTCGCCMTASPETS